MTTSDFTTAAPIGSGRRKSQPLSINNSKIALSNRSDVNKIRMYPNPLTTNDLTIENQTILGLNTILIFDMKGLRVFEQKFDLLKENTLTNISLPNLSTGMYIVLLSDENGNSYWNKIIKQ